MGCSKGLPKQGPPSGSRADLVAVCGGENGGPANQGEMDVSNPKIGGFYPQNGW